MERFKPDYLLPLSIFVSGVLISASILYVGGSPAQGNGSGGDDIAAVAISKDDVVLGREDAPVEFIEYGDYQCPFCARFFKETEPLIRKNYVETGKVKLTFRNLAFLGPESVAAAEAAACAKEQGKFWQYHEALYNAESADGEEHNGNLNRNLFVELAGRLGLDGGKFASCIDAKKYSTKIEEDNRTAATAGVRSTPTAFVNGKMVVGALPYAEFEKAIEAALAAQ
jgi:protein-disulfide isomerase